MAKTNNAGKWAFIIGLVVAILAGLITSISESIVLVILFVLGLGVGFLNISEKNSTKFLTGLIALFLIGVTSIGALTILGVVETYLESILENFLVFVGSAGLVVSIKVIFETSKQ
ncbi:MAG: hypothetical protein WDZ62_01355 [Candidatus Pacearchaeota archaeon]